MYLWKEECLIQSSLSFPTQDVMNRKLLFFYFLYISHLLIYTYIYTIQYIDSGLHSLIHMCLLYSLITVEAQYIHNVVELGVLFQKLNACLEEAFERGKREVKASLDEALQRRGGEVTGSMDTAVSREESGLSE